jgi:hypothetical protein
LGWCNGGGFRGGFGRIQAAFSRSGGAFLSSVTTGVGFEIGFAWFSAHAASAASPVSQFEANRSQSGWGQFMMLSRTFVYGVGLGLRCLPSIPEVEVNGLRDFADVGQRGA